MDKLIDDNNCTVIRLACDCGSQSHSLDFCIERNEQGEVVYCSVSPYIAGKPSLIWRIKTAWYNLLGKGGELGDLVIRPEDYLEFVKLGAALNMSAFTSGAGFIEE